MPGKYLARAAGAAAALVLFGAASAGVEVANTTEDDGVRGWLRSLVIELPAGLQFEMPMGMGSLTIVGGHCTGLTVDALNSSDNSSGLELEWGIELSGIGISCVVSAEQNGPLDIDITLARTSLAATMRIQPHFSPQAPDLPLPLGAVELTECNADIHFSEMSLKGNSSLATNFGGMVQGLLPFIGGFVNGPLCDGVREALAEQGARFFQEGVEFLQPLLLPPAVVPQPVALREPLLDWATYPPVMVVEQLVQERASLWANQIFEMTEDISFRTEIFSTMNVSLDLNRIRAEGVGHDFDPGLRVHANGSSLGLLADLGGPFGMMLSSGFALRVELPGQPVLSEQVNLSLGLDKMTMILRAMADQRKLESISLRQVLDSPECLVEATKGTADSHDASIALETLQLELKPFFQLDMQGTLENDVARFVTAVVGSLQDGYLPTVNALINGVLGQAREPLDQYLWSKVHALKPCASGEVVADGLSGLGESGGFAALWAMSLGVAALGLVVAVGAHLSLGNQRSSRQFEVRTGSEMQVDISEETEVEVQVCLARQACMPRALAVFYPFAVVSVMLLFAYADLALGASVNIIMEAGGQTESVGPFMSFSLLSTAIRSWASGAYLISALTVLMCGLWPCVKLNLLLAAWLVPPSTFSIKARGQVLHLLDTWGKYSFLDSWLLIITMRVFALSWESEVADVAIRLETVPTAAFYLFFLATTLTLVLGHVASEYHGHSERPEGPPAIPEQGEQQRDVSGVSIVSSAASSNAAFKPTDDAACPARLCDFAGTRVRVAITVSLATSILAVVAAMLFADFDFRFTGLVTDFLFGNASVRQTHSLVSIATSLMARKAEDVGLVVLAALFLILAFAVPLALLACLAFVWLAPLKHHLQESMLRFCYLLNAWASLDVVVLVLGILCFEFGTLAEYLVYKGVLAQQCTAVRDMFKAECLEMEFRMVPGIAVLLLAGILLLVVPKIALRACAEGAAKRRVKSLKSATSIDQLP